MEKKYQFKVYDSELHDYLDIKTNVSEFIREVLDDLRTGKLSYDNSEDSIDFEIKQAKLTSTKNQNKLYDLKKRNLIADVTINEYHAKHVDVVGDKPSRKAKEAMEHHVNNTKPYDKDAIYCPDCSWCTRSTDSIQFQIDRITDHIRIIHHRNFTEDEAKIISELLV